MKFLVMLFAVMSLPLIFNSCSKDDDEKGNNSIVGTWKFKEAVAGEVKTNSTANDGKTAVLVADWGKDDFSSYIFTFAADGTFKWIDSYETGTGTYTFKDGTLTVMWRGLPDDYDVYKASVINGVFILESDYTEDCNDLQLDDLIRLGIGDPTEFTVTKAIAKVSFSRQ